MTLPAPSDPAGRLLPFLVPMLLTYAAFIASRMVLMLFALHLGASSVSVAVLVSLLAGVSLVLPVPVGRLADRIGVALPTLVASAVMLVGALIPFVFRSLESLYVASTLIGMGLMVMHVAMHNAIGRVTEAHRRTSVFSVVAMCMSIASAIAPLLAGLLIDRVGYAYTFLAISGLCGTALVLQRTVMVAPPLPAVVADGTEGSRRLNDLWGNRPLRRALAVGAAFSLSYELFSFVVPLQGTRHGLSAFDIGLVMAAFGAAMIAVRLAVAFLPRGTSEWRVLAGVLPLAGVSFLFFPFSNSVGAMMISAFVMGLGLGSTQPMVMSLLHLTAPAGRSGEAVGVRTTIASACQAFIPLTLGMLTTITGTMPVFWALAGCLFAMGAVSHREGGMKP